MISSISHATSAGYDLQELSLYTGSQKFAKKIMRRHVCHEGFVKGAAKVCVQYLDSMGLVKLLNRIDQERLAVFGIASCMPLPLLGNATLHH